MATELGLDELRAHALTTIGMTKNDLDPGPAPPTSSTRSRSHSRSTRPIAAAIVNNLGVYATFEGDFRRTDELYAEAQRLAERFGDAASVRFVRGNRIWVDFMLGRWDQRARACGRRSSRSARRDRRTRWSRTCARSERASVRREETRTAHFEDSCGSLELSRDRGTTVGQLLGSLALIGSRLRRARAARRGARTRGRARTDRPGVRPARCADTARARSPTSSASVTTLREADAVSAGCDGCSPLARGNQARVRRRVCVARQTSSAAREPDHRGVPSASTPACGCSSDGRVDERRDVELERALAFYRSVDATHYVARAEGALAGAQSDSA